ncbi:MAG: WecB/TagA/CpsF family glycosyltransferase [Candidatus Portnoybacteria bacterium]|nr:WecB/TagA/CpsF family glycosyltransferase [Candidatus Portnoybacteria bacterium]
MKKEVFEINIDDITKEEAIKEIERLINTKEQHQISLPYSEFITRAQKDKEFKNILNSSTLCLCESRGLLISAFLIKRKLKENIYGVDLIKELSKKHKNKIFLYGASPESLNKTKEKLKIQKGEHGYQNQKKVIEKIRKEKPEILIVALGSPKQEEWIYNNLKKIPTVKIAIGVGGAFDFISKTKPRAPKIMQKIGTEWLWRLIIQPKRIKRISKGVFGLTYLILKHYTRKVFP